MIFHFFLEAKEQCNECSLCTRMADCLLKSLHFSLEGILASNSPPIKPKIVAKNIHGQGCGRVSVNLHSYRCQLLLSPNLGGGPAILHLKQSQTLRGLTYLHTQLISPKLKQMKKQPKHQFLAVGQRYRWYTVIKKGHDEILKSGTSCQIAIPLIAGCVGTSVCRVSKASVETSSLTTCLRQLCHTPVEMIC